MSELYAIVILAVGLACAVGLGCDRSPTRATATQPAAAPARDPKEAELAVLPVGLTVTHSPNPVRAAHGGRSGYPYSWVYQTSVSAADEPVTIEEFGCLVWQDGRWVFSTITGKPFTPADFSDWYGCPSATLRPGEAHTDPQNWSGSTVLEPERTRWYYIGRTHDGRRVKGEAVVETLAEVAAVDGDASSVQDTRE